MYKKYIYPLNSLALCMNFTPAVKISNCKHDRSGWLFTGEEVRK